MAFTISQVCDVVGVRKARVEMWISRGRFHVEHEPEAGLARKWSLRDAMRLAVAAALADTKDAGAFDNVMDYAVRNYRPGGEMRFLCVVCVAPPDESIGASWTCELVNESDLASSVSRSLGGAVVVDLDKLLGDVKTRLAALI